MARLEYKPDGTELEMAFDSYEVYRDTGDRAPMLTEKAVYFDMDGTIADLFSVPDWLPRLRSFDADVYREADLRVDYNLLHGFIDKCHRAGYRVGVVSWFAMVTTPQYDDEVVLAKLAWLTRFDLDHQGPGVMDEVVLSPYGWPKSEIVEVSRNSILIDDSAENRIEWENAGNGPAYGTDDLPKLFEQLSSSWQ